MSIAVLILGYATLISCQYAPPFPIHPPIFPAQVYGPPDSAPPAPVYGPPAPPQQFTPLIPPPETGESSLVPPQFSPPATVGTQASSAAQTIIGAFSFPAPPSSQYSAPSFKK